MPEPIMERVLVAQIGARMHYAVPRMLHAAGMLEELVTDACASKGWPRLLNHLPDSFRPAPLKRLLSRVPEGVPSSRITVLHGLGRTYAWRRARASSQSASTAAHLWAGQTFCRQILKRGLGKATTLYTFNSAGLELLEAARQRGLRAIVEQTIAPCRIERALLAQEQAAFPRWEGPEDDRLDELMAREEAEWREASLILCGSEFVREGIRHSGGPVERCAVVSYAVECPPPYVGGYESTECCRQNSPLRILTVGALGLRKGAPYVLEAAKALGGRAEFRWVGPLNVAPAVQREFAKFVQLTGPVPRASMVDQYRWADIFLLPSICGGSATASYEALASGLPMIVTPNTGSIIEAGEQGFIVPIRSAAAIVERIETLLRQPELRQIMSSKARALAEQNTIEAYAARLISALENRDPSPCHEASHNSLPGCNVLKGRATAEALGCA